MPVQLWTKFVFICAFSGVTSLARRPIGAILQYPETAELYRRVMEETAAVDRARGVAIPNDCVENWIRLSRTLNPGAYGSMYYDLASERRMEVDSLNGCVVRLGQKAGVATPLNFAVQAALKPYEDGVHQSLA